MRHGWARRAMRDFETNPKTQFRFHRYAMYFWLLNGVAALVVFFWMPDAWLGIGVFWTLLLSLYANWDTDYDAMSASGAWMEAQSVNAKVQEQEGEPNDPIH